MVHDAIMLGLVEELKLLLPSSCRVTVELANSQRYRGVRLGNNAGMSVGDPRNPLGRRVEARAAEDCMVLTLIYSRLDSERGQGPFYDRNPHYVSEWRHYLPYEDPCLVRRFLGLAVGWIRGEADEDWLIEQQVCLEVAGRRHR